MGSFLALGVLALSSVASAEVTVEKIDYKGWTGCYRISNGEASLVAVPAIGRVMHYSFVNGANVLWENESLLGQKFAPDARNYRNYGGDKLWVAPQSGGNWPPDPAIDGQPWTVEVIANGIRLISPRGGAQPVQFRRDITLAAVGTEVTFVNSMANKGSRRELGLVQATQVDSPSSVTMGIGITAQQPAGWFGYGARSLDSKFETLTGSKLTLTKNPQKVRKFGARSATGRLEAALGSIRFSSTSTPSRGGTYPDSGSAHYIETAMPAMTYMTLAHLSDVARRDNDEVVFMTTTWNLAKG